MYPTPSPSWSEGWKSFADGLPSTNTVDDYVFVCILPANLADPVCEAPADRYPGVDFTKHKLAPFVYKPDAYWHKHARIPSHTSAMVINGGLDFQTPNEGERPSTRDSWEVVRS